MKIARKMIVFLGLASKGIKCEGVLLGGDGIPIDLACDVVVGLSSRLNVEGSHLWSAVQVSSSIAGMSIVAEGCRPYIHVRLDN